MSGSYSSLNDTLDHQLEDLLNTDLNSSSELSEEVPDLYYSYHDVGYRAKVFLSQAPILLAIILGVISVLSNTFSVLALSQVRMRFTAHLRLIISLAISDIIVGVSVMLHFIDTIVNPQYDWEYWGTASQRLRYRCTYMVIKALNNTSLVISLLNLFAMAIDRYIAIMKPLHYQVLMGKRRTSLLILALWVVAILCGFSDFFSVLHDFKYHLHKYNFCEMVWLSRYQEEYLVFAVAILGLFFMLFVYIKIYCKVKYTREGNISSEQSHVRHEAKWNRGALVTTLLILGTFVLCWLPNCLYQVSLIVLTQTDQSFLQANLGVLLEVDRYLYDLLLVNSICDPIIYTARMREVQLGYRRLYRRLCCPHRQPGDDMLYGTAETTLRRAAGGTSSRSGRGTCVTLSTHCSINSKASCGSNAQPLLNPLQNLEQDRSSFSIKPEPSNGPSRDDVRDGDGDCILSVEIEATGET